MCSNDYQRLHQVSVVTKVTTNSEKAQLLRDINAMELGFTVEIKPIHGSRSVSQNSSIHLAFKQIADVLNDAGLHMNTVLKEGTEIPWSGLSVKEMMFKPVSLAMTGKGSTTELSTVEISNAYDVMMKHLGEHFGVFIPFPSHE